MKIINCPLNGPRNAQEFVCGGEMKLRPDKHHAGHEVSTRQWVDYIFMEENRRGVVREWWCHLASGYWFIAERNMSTDTILRTYTSQEFFAHPAPLNPDP